MDSRPVLLFGLTLVVYSGFLLVARGVGNFQDPLYWGLHLGLLVAAVGAVAAWRGDD